MLRLGVVVVGGAFKKLAIPLLIKAWNEKALPHLGEREIAGAIVGRVSISCCEPVMYLIRRHPNICRRRNISAARRLFLFTSEPPACLQSRSIYSQLRFTSWGGSFCLEHIFFSPPLTGEVSMRSWPSLLNRTLLPDRVSQTEHKAALQYFTSGLTPWSVCLAGMISNLDDFSTLCMKMECYLPLSGLLPIYLT